jgi:hypothetical protein
MFVSDNITKEELLLLVKEAVAQATEVHPLSPEEIQWVRLAIEAQAERAQLRKAIIHKSLAGLVWMCLLAAGSWVVDLISTHWK